MRSSPIIAASGWLLAAVLRAAEPAVPVVLALDSSRSITPRELTAACATLARAVEALPTDAPVGLLDFNDTPRWDVPFGMASGEVRAALSTVVPAGRYTVLRDALFVIGNRLTAGGVVILATDGRDEDSAATVEDVARLYTEKHVRIVAIGMGRRVDDLALRRLALLTGGSYLGRLPAVNEHAIAPVITAAARAIAEEIARPVPAPQAPPAAATAALPSATTAPPPERRTSAPWLLPTLLAAVLVLGLVALIVWRLRHPQAQRTCPRCGNELAAWETECPHCQIEELRDHLESPISQAVEVDDAALLEPSVFERVPMAQQLERTFALGEQAVLVVKERRKPPRVYILDPATVFSVGRSSEVNTLSFRDPTLSAQHFKIVAKDGEYFVVDLRTTNGTVVNGQRVRARRLRPGDAIRAGEIEFEFRVEVKRTV